MAALRVCAVSLLLVVLATTADARATSCRIEDCPNFRAIRYHEELGCVRSDSSSECCPTRFNCSLLLSVDKTKCYYEGKIFEPGTETEDQLVSKCLPSCTCSYFTDGTFEGEATFDCPGTDCTLYGIPQEQQSYCYVTTDVNVCCPTGVRCVYDTDSPNDLAECPYQGKTYREDEEIDAASSQCKKCVCQRGFDGTLDGPWCKRRTCDYTLFRTHSELKTCAPVFREGNNCCAPIFHCPSADDSVVRNSESTTTNEGGHCSFGNHTLDVGDELLVGTDGCVRCRCDVPPFITCTMALGPQCEGHSFPF